MPSCCSGRHHRVYADRRRLVVVLFLSHARSRQLLLLYLLAALRFPTDTFFASKYRIENHSDTSWQHLRTYARTHGSSRVRVLIGTATKHGSCAGRM